MLSPHPGRRWIVLSPHLDDAALSIGGLIAALTCFARVEIWSLFCNASFQGPYSELADWLHAEAGGATGSRLAWARKMEDRRACRQLGAAARHFEWKDTPYRKGADGRFLYHATQPGRWHDGDNPLIADMITQLGRSLGELDVLLSPLAVGGHVDHLIARHAAETLRGPTLMYYPDVPYVQLFPEQVAEAIDGLCPVRYKLRRDEIVTWIASVKSYVSQIRMLESAAGRVPELISRHARESAVLYRSCEHSSSDLKDYRIFG